MSLGSRGGKAMFKDRNEAGYRLARRLRGYVTDIPLVVGINRGGLAVAKPVAQLLGAPCDVIITRPVVAPDDEGLVLGAVALGGGVAFDEPLAAKLGIDETCLAGAVDLARRKLAAAAAAVRGDRPLPRVAGGVAVLVSDGLGMPHDVLAAVHAMRAGAPRWLVVAMPVCAPELRSALSRADAVVTLAARPAPGSVYESTRHPDDAEAVRLLGPRATATW
jgi:putative phosphoribosyl transferase